MGELKYFDICAIVVESLAGERTGENIELHDTRSNIKHLDSEAPTVRLARLTLG
jgi:hypothetical protein